MAFRKGAVRVKDLPIQGQQFNKLTALYPERHPQNGEWRWRCRCECGQTTLAKGSELLSGYRYSCGCSWHERRTKHGLWKRPEYEVWKLMHARCRDPKRGNYKHYGGRGIRVCERWKDFAAFYEDMGPRPSPEHKLERRENGGDYYKGNCYWATQLEQMQNTRANRNLTYGEKTACMAEWARITGINYMTIYMRLKKGLSDEEALTTSTPMALRLCPEWWASLSV